MIGFHKQEIQGSSSFHKAESSSSMLSKPSLHLNCPRLHHTQRVSAYCRQNGTGSSHFSYSNPRERAWGGVGHREWQSHQGHEEMMCALNESEKMFWELVPKGWNSYAILFQRSFFFSFLNISYTFTWITKITLYTINI